MIKDYKSLPEYFIHRVKSNFDDRLWVQDGGRSQTRGEFYLQAQSIANHLIKNGIKKDDRIGIISNTRPEYLAIDLAIQLCGATTVAIYQTLTSSEIAYQLYDANVKNIFVENKEQFEKIQAINNKEILIPKVEDREAKTIQLVFNNIFSIEKVEGISSISQIENSEFKFESASNLSSIIYTSGTTGMPKGVLQTQINHLANVRQVWDAGFLKNVKSIFLFLPLAHSFARLMANLALVGEIELVFPRILSTESSKIDPNLITVDIKNSNANVFPVVPRLLEKIQSGIEEKTKDGIKGKLIKLAIDSGKRLNADQQWNRKTGLIDGIIYQGLDPLRKIILSQVFGTNFMFCVSGGARLNPLTYDFFKALNITILEGYGLTETCVATNVNLPGEERRTSVGKVLAPDIEVKILEDGEICFRGENISPGYLNRPEATASSWDSEDYFHTGDLGRLDSDKYLYVTGRKKELIVTSYGKKIAPIEIEENIKKYPLISQVVLVGDGYSYLVALITVNKAFSTANDETEVEEILEEVNSKIASYEQVKKFKILEEDFTIENNFLTPTFKIKRDLVIKHYKNLIDEMYNS